jgi:hypothetical protein
MIARAWAAVGNRRATGAATAGKGWRMSDFPLPGKGDAAVAVPAPGVGPGRWAGAPSAALDDGGFLIAYRMRVVDQRGAATIIARSTDGEHLTTVATLDKDRFGAESLERPALLRTDAGQWRLYVSCATPSSKHWRIDVLEARDAAALEYAEPVTAFPGDEQTAVKDPVIRRSDDGWQAWICCHPLDEPGEEDRMSTAYATSEDGLRWDWHGTVLRPRAGEWDARGARVTAVLADGRATYDGRATKEENFFERTGIAQSTGKRGHLRAVGNTSVSDVRYLDILPLTDGGYRLFYEAPLPDGSHELRTELVPRTC